MLCRKCQAMVVALCYSKRGNHLRMLWRCLVNRKSVLHDCWTRHDCNWPFQSQMMTFGSKLQGFDLKQAALTPPKCRGNRWPWSHWRRSPGHPDTALLPTAVTGFRLPYSKHTCQLELFSKEQVCFYYKVESVCLKHIKETKSQTRKHLRPSI